MRKRVAIFATVGLLVAATIWYVKHQAATRLEWEARAARALFNDMGEPYSSLVVRQSTDGRLYIYGRLERESQLHTVQALLHPQICRSSRELDAAIRNITIGDAKP